MRDLIDDESMADTADSSTWSLERTCQHGGSDTNPASVGEARADETVVAIHQPNYLPWIGYFHKIYRSDVFVFLDDVEYTSNSWINRNRIKTPHGWTWLTVPVHGSDEPIADVEIAGDRWRDKHRKSIQASYANAAHFDAFVDVFDRTYARSWDLLCELNVYLVRELAERIGLECRFVRSSTFDVDATKSERVARLCEEVGGDRYVSGEGARSYNDREQFEAADVALEYQSFDHPSYEQRFDDFVPNLSVVDVLVNVGADRTREFLQSMDEG